MDAWDGDVVRERGAEGGGGRAVVGGVGHDGDGDIENGGVEGHT